MRVVRADDNDYFTATDDGPRSEVPSAVFKKLSVRGGADKSLARPISRCRRTVSIVSVERGASSCAVIASFSCFRG